MPRSPASMFRTLASNVRRRPEFIGCASAGLLIGLAFARTDWTPYDHQPHEIMDRVAETRSLLAQAGWPESERARFLKIEPTMVASVVETALYDDFDLSDYRPSQRQIKKLGQFFQLEEPAFVPVRHLIASSGRVLVEQAPVAAVAMQAPETPEAEPVLQEAWLDELRSRRGTRGQPETDGAVSYDDEYPGYPEFDPGNEPGIDSRALRVGHGYPYVSVRGLFDVSAQIAAYSEAVHRTRANAEKLLELIDFYLERQKFDRQRGDWSSWEPVDIEVFRDVALSASGFEPDVVSSESTDAAITCPLLIRITGRWQTQATHPLLANAELSPGEVERESAYLQAVMELLREQRQSQRPESIRKGGFHDLLRDARTLERELMEPVMSGPRVRTPVQSGFGMPMPFGGNVRQQANPNIDELTRKIADRIDPKQTDRDLREWVRKRVTQAPSRQLLFRYFDFNVEPGATYRYQVRLELRNPNYGRSLGEAGEAHVVEGKTRLTPWSEPTVPVTVRKNVEYFLTDLEPARHRLHPRARINVFQYDTNLGSTVQQELAVEFGQQIKGTVQATLYDPAAGIRKEADYEFRSRDVLLDALPDLEFDRSLHPDLQIPSGSTGLAQVPEYALVLADDELRTIDPVSQADELARQQRYMELQDEQLRHLRSETTHDGDWQSEEERTMYEEVFGVSASADDEGPRPRRRNALQRR